MGRPKKGGGNAHCYKRHKKEEPSYSNAKLATWGKETYGLGKRERMLSGRYYGLEKRPGKWLSTNTRAGGRKPSLAFFGERGKKIELRRMKGKKDHGGGLIAKNLYNTRITEARSDRLSRRTGRRGSRNLRRKGT